MLRLSAVFLVLFSLLSPAFAVEYSDIRTGQTYDYDVSFQFTNPRAEVLRKEGGRVKIQILEGDRRGEVIWVSPRNLLTTDQSRKQETENITTGVAVGAAIFCAVTDSCKDQKQAAASAPRAAPAPAPRSGKLDYPKLPLRNIQLTNTCDKTIDIWVAYRKGGNFLGTPSYWTAEPSASFQISNKGKVLQSDSDQIWVYARSKDKSLVWSGDRKINLEGKRSLDMKLANVFVKNNRWNIRFTCE